MRQMEHFLFFAAQTARGKQGQVTGVPLFQKTLFNGGEKAVRHADKADSVKGNNASVTNPGNGLLRRSQFSWIHIISSFFLKFRLSQFLNLVKFF